MTQLKREKIKAPRTKFRWDRGTIFYWVVAVLDPSKAPEDLTEPSAEEKESHKAAVKDGWRGHIFELKSPILMDRSLTNAISSKDFVIYTPFKLNKKASVAHTFDEVKIPVLPDVHTSRFQSIPDYAVRGAVGDVTNHPETDVFYGIRIDTDKTVDPTLVLEMFLRLVRQETKQWWVTTARNPFDYGYRMSFELNKDFAPRDVLMDTSLSEIEAPWTANIATQKLIGFETSLNTKSWANLAKQISYGGKAESAISYFLEAISSFMADNDSQTILLLALFFEVAENKARLLKGDNHESKNKNILSNPYIAKSEQIVIFRKLITDRDNIAHGRGPYHQKNDPALLAIYLDTAAVFCNSYLEFCRQYDWAKVIATEL